MEDYSEMKDAQLVAKAKNGDEVAFSVIADRYRSTVKYRAASYFLPGGDNDDVLQEGMIGLFQAVRDYECGRGAEFASFAQLCIDRHLGMAVRKALSKKNSPLNSSVPIEDETDNKRMNVAQSPESILIDRESAENTVTNLKSTLSKFEKKVFELMLSEHTYTEIAAILNISEKASDNAIQRIKRKMKMLKEQS